MQKFIRQIVPVFRFLYFKFFERINQFVTPSEAWHDNSDIVWRKKISLNKKQCVESFNIDCLLAWEWPTTTGSPENDVWLTREDQQIMTNEVSLLRVLLIVWNKFYFWNFEYRKIIYVNCGVKNYLKEGDRSCEKKAWKTIQSCTGFEPFKLTSQLGAGRWVGS